MSKPFLYSTILVLLLTLFPLNPLLSQSVKIDSLISEINHYSSTDSPDTALARLHHDLGAAYTEKAETNSAIEQDLLALKDVGDLLSLQFQIHNSLGSNYLSKDNLSESLSEFKKALKVAVEMDNQINIGIVHYNLSMLYERSSNDSLSYAHLKIASDLMLEAGDTLKTIYLLNSLGTYEIENNQKLIASKRFNKALDLSIQFGDSTLISNSYNNIANYYLLTEDTTTALRFLKKSYAIDKVSGTDENIAIVTYNIATMYSITNKLDSALVYIELAKQKAKATNRVSLLKPIYNMVFNLYYESGKYDSLQTVFDDYQTISDSLFTRENLKKYAESQSEIELITSKQENALLILNEQASKQKFIYLLIVTGLLILILVGSLFSLNRYKSQKEIAESLHQQTKIQNQKIEQQQKELIKQNEKLEKNSLYKDRIMSLLAHDLRTPFASINSLNHLVKASGELNDKQESFMETSNKIIAGGLDLISDILHIYKLESVQDYDFELLNISQLLTHSADKIRPILTVKHQNLILDFDQNVEFIINREMLQSAVDNLLSNASKYSDDGTSITIKMFKENNKLNIHIIDQGQGFSEEEQQNIFDRFNKFSRTSISNESSTGLGLFLVKGFVEKLGGEIILKSTPNIGSTFILIFEKKEIS